MKSYQVDMCKFFNTNEIYPNHKVYCEKNHQIGACMDIRSDCPDYEHDIGFDYADIKKEYGIT